MDNQHRLIQTYRELSQDEIDLMNQCKVLEAQVLEMQDKLLQRAKQERHSADIKLQSTADAQEIHNRIKTLDDAIRSASIAKTELQTGFMWLVRSVARPAEPALKPE
jgi:hypothetical protein